jgi:predicted GIY-YIG superfamily endonuclease
MSNLWSVYVLFLKDDHIYVGNTPQKSLETRLQKHFKAEGAEWTKIHKPDYSVKPILFYDIPTKDEAMVLESNLTLKYMKNYGIDKVRGHIHARVTLTEQETISILMHLAHDESLCFNCYNRGHYISDCPERG